MRDTHRYTPTDTGVTHGSASHLHIIRISHVTIRVAAGVSRGGKGRGRGFLTPISMNRLDISCISLYFLWILEPPVAAIFFPIFKWCGRWISFWLNFIRLIHRIQFQFKFFFFYSLSLSHSFILFFFFYFLLNWWISFYFPQWSVNRLFNNIDTRGARLSQQTKSEFKFLHSIKATSS